MELTSIFYLEQWAWAIQNMRFQIHVSLVEELFPSKHEKDARNQIVM